ncbi:MAG: DUF1499 domain-containing protein [Armatimonadota bacterium]
MALPPDDSLPTVSDATARKRHLRAVALAWTFGIAVAAIYVLVRDVPAAGWRINDVTTGETKEYPELQSRIYDSTPENTTLFAAAAASRLTRWKVIRTDRVTHTVICEVKTPLNLFTDDVTIRIEPFGPSKDASRVQIHSRSRVGRSDLGQNAQHIRELQSAMDEKLPRLNP